jgi:predicted nucleic acid-binding protein
VFTATQRIREICQATAPKPKVALDTCCVQYYINKPPVQPWADCLDTVFGAGLEGRVELYVSTVVVSELLTHVHFTHRGKGYDPELDLLSILNRHFLVLDVSGEVARAAGRLRGNYVPSDKIVLETPDALIGATSLANGHTLFITNDEQLARALPSENCIYLKQLALDWLAQHFPDGCFNGTNVVRPSRRGKGLFPDASIGTSDLGSVQPHPSAHWKHVLADAFAGATALNEPCVFFLLTRRSRRKTETIEVLLWHETLDTARPAQRMVKRLEDHLGIKYNRERDRYEAAPEKSAFVLFFASMQRERARQSQPCYASKSEDQKEADAWDSYLRPLWRLRSALNLPQTTWLLCEAGVARYLKPDETLDLLNQAKNVLGWQDR